MINPDLRLVFCVYWWWAQRVGGAWSGLKFSARRPQIEF